MNISAIVLAAGKGTRMKSNVAKVLHSVFYKPMVTHVVETLQGLSLEQTVVVVGHRAEDVMDELVSAGTEFVTQEEQNGTGHAVLITEDMISAGSDNILIVCGDTPLVRGETLLGFINSHSKSKSVVSVMGTELDDPTNYGRFITDGPSLLEIVEEKDADFEQKKIKLINGGIYCVSKDFLFKALRSVGTDNAQGEMYLTDIVKIANADKQVVNSFICEESFEIMGVNSRNELAGAHQIKQKIFIDNLLNNGVSILNSNSVTIHPAVTIGADTIIEPSVSIGKDVFVGHSCTIGSHSHIENCYIGDNVTIGAGTILSGIKVQSGSQIQMGTKLISENSLTIQM